MKNTAFLISILFFISISYSGNKINYTDPLPDAKYVSTGNNIVIGFEKQITLNETEILNSISVTGSKSMHHEGTVVICNNKKKIIFNPSMPFQEGEEITVKLSGKLLQLFNPDRKEYEYRFNTAAKKVKLDINKYPENKLNIAPYFAESNNLLSPPVLTVSINNNPSEGYIFIAPFSSTTFNIIANKYGSTYWYSQMNRWCGDFKKQPNGHLTYWDGYLVKHIEMDENYNNIDTFACGNGYFADIHEFRLLNEHAFLMAYDTQTVDMSQIVQGGNPNASVIGLIIQELDEYKNVVFQWRSWDHFNITDALHENLTALYIDYVHGNAIEIDNDNNILISSRHLDEITKINHTTGNIIWRLGGLQNQFTFVNDTLGFNYQHAVRRISNGNIIIFDNGNWHTPQFSRVVEYSIDEINKTATLVWEYRHSPSVFSAFMGNAQRLENGNTFIAWGGTIPTVTEVTPEGSVVFEAAYPTGVLTYRAYKFDWNTPVAIYEGNIIIPASYKLHQNYPNPFNPNTKIAYDIPKASNVEISVFDITGKELIKLVLAYLQPGSYTASFDAANLSSGIYIYRLIAGEFTASKKMILLK